MNNIPITKTKLYNNINEIENNDQRTTMCPRPPRMFFKINSHPEVTDFPHFSYIV